MTLPVCSRFRLLFFLSLVHSCQVHYSISWLSCPYDVIPNWRSERKRLLFVKASTQTYSTTSVTFSRSWINFELTSRWGRGGIQLLFWYRCEAWRAKQRGLWTDHCWIWDPSELNFSTKCSHVNWILAAFEALELNSLLILRLWSLKILEICNLGMKVRSWELKYAEIGSYEKTGRSEKRVFKATHTHLVSSPPSANITPSVGTLSKSWLVWQVFVISATYLNLSCPAVSHICNLIFCPETSIILVPNSTPIVCGQSAITENQSEYKQHEHYIRITSFTEFNVKCKRY